MPLLKPSNDQDKLSISLDKELIEEIIAYCQWANIRKPDEFVEQAALLVLRKDKDWKMLRKSKSWES